jgi:hypothetical protein
MPTNHNLDADSPLACLLVGQPTLRRTMKLAVLAALEQRVALRHTMPPMTSQEPAATSPATSGSPAGPTPLFSDDATALIHTTACGYPPRRQQPRAPGPRRHLHRREGHRRRAGRPLRRYRSHRHITRHLHPQPPAPCRPKPRSHPGYGALTPPHIGTANAVFIGIFSDAQQVAGLGGRFQRLAEPVFQPGGALEVVPDLHPVDRGDPGGAGLPGPGRGVGGLRLLGFKPATGLQRVARTLSRTLGESADVPCKRSTCASQASGPPLARTE